ncbi:hypothetical protein CPJCM30710_12070 [Clostridium polyendosporum]|uniref:RsgI N-terminal anti-sigma domain-containing protein n=1 Tax=Clostridium polyendosporum TaxID=69208 RepID=A0A919RZF5_9CLOT|nr:hypothetical protein [Clostridium polyendosporum]GIM28541.1 hypothetical protein CPJCM30710_12070 [Clostridium polyendosporum]
MEVFIKDKYIFSTKPKLRAVKEEDKESEKEIFLFLKGIRLYGVNLKSLVRRTPRYDIKNILLNIAFYIVKDSELYSEFTRKREIPVAKLAKLTRTSKVLIESWRDFLIVYVIILANPNYRILNNYMNIEERDADSNAIISVIEKNEKSVIYRGLALSNRKRSSIIITNLGDFIKIKNSNEDKVLGEELSGKEKKGLKHYKKQLVGATALIFMTLPALYYIYNMNYSTIIINSTSQIKVEVNVLNRINYIYSATTKGQLLVHSINVVHKDIDEGIYEIIKYANENKMIPSKEMVIIISGHNLRNDWLPMSEQYIKANKIKVLINNRGVEKEINYSQDDK